MRNTLTEMKPHEVKDGNFNKVIFGIGSTESHGEHMPMGTDWMIANGLAKNIADQFSDILLLPPVMYGVSEHHKNFNFTLYIQAETMINILKDIFASIHNRGITKIIVVNGHDGNIAPIEIAARAYKMSHPEVSILTLPSWWENLDAILPEGTLSEWNGGHGGETETSMGMALFPELIDLSYAKTMIPKLKNSQVMEMKWSFSEISTVGSVGYPDRANPEKAKLIMEVLVNNASEYIRYLDEMDWKYSV